MNWMAINTDVKKIENICHGAVLRPNDDLQELIRKTRLTREALVVDTGLK